jgi:hypothetical protein
MWCWSVEGLCGGDNSTCGDCAGIPNGPSVVDECNQCKTDVKQACRKDCVGVWGGSQLNDHCGICNGNNASCAGNWPIPAYVSHTSSALINIRDLIHHVMLEQSDCAGMPNGRAVRDKCGACDDVSANDCRRDCAGTSSSAHAQ